jgi:regulator of protease activity HflC (stomatin/prohibitin superfamily)
MTFLFTLIVIAIAAIFFSMMKASTVKGSGGKNAAMNSPFAPMLVLILASIFAIAQFVAIVPAGNAGVVDFFGVVSERPLYAGINLKNPFASVIYFSIKTQDLMEVMEVPSREGLTVTLDASVLFHLEPAKASEIYRTVGKNYVDIVLIPQFRSVCRGVTAMYEAKALYTSQREFLSKQIQEGLQKLVSPRGIEIETAPLRKVGLPKGLSEAIEEKLRAEQESQRMEFVLTKEKLEAERKQIEARGISAFQRIVSQGISEQLLRWKGIEATEKIAGSANTKVIVIGAGKDGLPLIMDTK